MIFPNPLLEICNRLSSQISGNDQESHSLIVKVAGVLWATGADSESINQILRLVVRSYECGGRRAVSGMIKGWSNAIRSLMSRGAFDTSVVGHCKQARNCRRSLRKLGATAVEINEIIDLYDGRCGIPPILLLPAYWRILLPGASKDVFIRVVPLSNLGRACPLADKEKCEESEKSFFKVTGKVPSFVFDLRELGRRYGELCRGSPPGSRISLNAHAEYSTSREDGGKMGLFIRGMVDNYLLQTIDQLVPEKPTRDLVDVLGNLVLKRDDWREGTPITDVMYPGLGQGGGGLDGRLGLFGLDAAIRDLHAKMPGCVMSDAPYLTFGPFIPNISFEGTLPSRVHTLAEEGYKGRVITIVRLSVSIIQSVARHFLDAPMRTDKAVQIGLLSKVKLYDFMVHMNGGRKGVVEFNHPSVFLRTALSADLTTATDTPPREGSRSLLTGFSELVSGLNQMRFIQFAIEVGCSPRGFESRFLPNGYVHNCGIPMGEGLSGTYLNVMSGVVRCILVDFMDYFDFYVGTSIEDASEFSRDHMTMIQDYLDHVEFDDFQDSSSQSGDDLIFMSHFPPAEIRRFLILLYTILGEVPSESTFYSSEFYGTFTEEAIIRNDISLGWVFIDCIKPRLYSHRDKEGVAPILSHISQITGQLRYVDDDDYISRVCDVVDVIIHSNVQIWERVHRYNLVPAFPPWLGGLDHPHQLMEGLEVDIPLVDRELVRKLLLCDLEELWSIKYSWATDDLPEDEDAREIRETLIRVFNVFQELPVGNDEDNEIIDLHTYSEDMLLDQGLFPSYNTYRSELVLVKQQLGLANLDEIAEIVANGLRFLQSTENDAVLSMNPLIRLRNRREFLLSRTRGLDADGHEFMWSDIKSLNWRLTSSFRGKFVICDTFLDLLDLKDLPSLLIASPTFVEWG
jgi:hypothetical protein